LKHHVGYNETDGHISKPLYKGHLSITDNFDQSLGWVLYTGFTVYRIDTTVLLSFMSVSFCNILVYRV